MKSYPYIITLLFIAIFGMACSSEPEVEVPKEKPTLSVLPTQFTNVPTSGGRAEISITSNQSSFEATSDKDWCKLTLEGTTANFSIVVLANTTGSARNATVTVTAGKATPVKISVSQLGETSPQLSVSPTQITNIAATGGNAKITVTTNQSSWDATSDNTWCKVTGKTDKDFTIVVDANSSSAARSAVVTVSAGSATPVKITVSQLGAAPSLSISPAVYTVVFSATSASEEFVYNVTTNLSSWDVKVTTTGTSWCKVSKDVANNRFTITADPNDSSTPRGGAIVTISAGSATPLQITVNQKSKSTQDSEDFGYGKGEKWD